MSVGAVSALLWSCVPVLLVVGVPVLFAVFVAFGFAPEIIEHAREIRTQWIIGRLRHKARIDIAKAQESARLDREIAKLLEER